MCRYTLECCVSHHIRPSLPSLSHSKSHIHPLGAPGARSPSSRESVHGKIQLLVRLFMSIYELMVMDAGRYHAVLDAPKITGRGRLMTRLSQCLHRNSSNRRGALFIPFLARQQQFGFPGRVALDVWPGWQKVSPCKQLLS